MNIVALWLKVMKSVQKCATVAKNEEKVVKWANRNCTTILQRTSQPIICSTPNVALAHSNARL